MKEDFLYYLWQFGKFQTSNLKTVSGQELIIFNPGQYQTQSGPDFFNALIEIDNQKWAGNIEIHIKSSDWYLHHHQEDNNYENVILHIVWEHDTEVFRKNNAIVPVLQLKDYVETKLLEHYKLLMKSKKWIPCENVLSEFDKIVVLNWFDRLYFERLEQKSQAIYHLLKETDNDWETVFFCLLAKNFGLNINGSIFMEMAQSLTYNTVRKEQHGIENLEALFLGKCGLLQEEVQDDYALRLKSKWQYLKHKYSIDDYISEPVHFFKLRPDNFPTIRLVQLAQLYCHNHNLFSKCLSLKSPKEFYELCNVKASEYWETHYIFDKFSKKKRKTLSKSFIDLLLINTIIPVIFVYNEYMNRNSDDFILNFMSELKPEKNIVIDKFSEFGIRAESALQTQAMIHLKKNYCDSKKCLQCNFGKLIMGQTT